MGIGEAAVTVLSERGVPTPVVHTRLRGAALARWAPARRRRRRREGLAAVREVRRAARQPERARAARGAPDEARARCRRPRWSTSRSRSAEARARARERRRTSATSSARARGRRCSARCCAACSGCCASGCERPSLRSRRRTRPARGDAGVRRDASCARTRRSGRRRAGFPDEVFAQARRARLARPQVRRRTPTGSPTRCWSEELARCGSGGLAAGIGAHNGIATPPLATFGTDGAAGSAGSSPRSAARRSPRWRSPSPTPAPTSPRSARAPRRSTAAGSSTARRPSSPTACARTSTSPRSARGPRPGTAASPSSSSSPARASRASPLEKLGWHASDTAEIAFDDVFVPDDAPARRGGPRLLPDHGQLPVGAAADVARRGRRDARARSSA